MVLDGLAKRWGKRFKKGNGPFRIVSFVSNNEKVLLVKPMTYMNRSGRAVSMIVNEYRIQPSRVLAVCDDLNLPLGRLRLREEGSAGGHKGLVSMIEELGTERFPRLRAGIGLDGKEDVVRYVLSPFPRSERNVLHRMVDRGGQAVMDFIEKGILPTMTVVNRISSVEENK